MKKDIPIVKCFKEDNLMVFFCPFGCTGKHRHGAGQGFRSSHCPNYEGDYYLKYYNKNELKTIMKLARLMLGEEE